MSKIAVFPGSFDPITKGHVNVLERGLDLFDKVVVAIGHNSAKKYLYTLEKRLQILNKLYIIRGLRSSTDFEYEKTIAQLNHSQNNDIDTIFLMCEPQYGHIHSSVVRDIIKHGGDASPFIPATVFSLL